MNRWIQSGGTPWTCTPSRGGFESLVSVYESEWGVTGANYRPCVRFPWQRAIRAEAVWLLYLLFSLSKQFWLHLPRLDKLLISFILILFIFTLTPYNPFFVHLNSRSHIIFLFKKKFSHSLFRKSWNYGFLYLYFFVSRLIFSILTIYYYY